MTSTTRNTTHKITVNTIMQELRDEGIASFSRMTFYRQERKLGLPGIQTRKGHSKTYTRALAEEIKRLIRENISKRPLRAYPGDEIRYDLLPKLKQLEQARAERSITETDYQVAKKNLLR